MFTIAFDHILYCGTAQFRCYYGIVLSQWLSTQYNELKKVRQLYASCNVLGVHVEHTCKIDWFLYLLLFVLVFSSYHRPTSSELLLLIIDRTDKEVTQHVYDIIPVMNVHIHRRSMQTFKSKYTVTFLQIKPNR